jgi:hypothetical protein
MAREEQALKQPLEIFVIDVLITFINFYKLRVTTNNRQMNLPQEPEVYWVPVSNAAIESSLQWPKHFLEMTSMLDGMDMISLASQRQKDISKSYCSREKYCPG